MHRLPEPVIPEYPDVEWDDLDESLDSNRQLNAALHRIAVTQIRMHQPAKDYMAKKRAEGMSKTEALRCLKRRLARVVFKTMTSMQAPADGLTAAGGLT